MIKKLLRKGFQFAGYDIVKSSNGLSGESATDKVFVSIYEQCRPYTMTSPDRMHALYKAVRYVVEAGLKGDFVECGVWRGGSSMVIALTLKHLNATDRSIYLYDTFEGMSEPTEKDVDVYGKPAKGMMEESDKTDTESVWCYADLNDVKNNLGKTGYPTQNIHFVKGKVEDTIPATLPSHICLLRLDTDWYESTYHEFKHLYPLLCSKGVLIIDDYGHWEGAKLATDQYLKENNINLLLHTIDYTGRMAQKV